MNDPSATPVSDLRESASSTGTAGNGAGNGNGTGTAWTSPGPRALFGLAAAASARRSGRVSREPREARVVAWLGPDAGQTTYLFPEGFEPGHLIADQLAGNGRRVFAFEEAIDSPHTFLGHLDGHRFAVEVRPRSATILSPLFAARRDLLLLIKEYAERRAASELDEGPP